MEAILKISDETEGGEIVLRTMEDLQNVTTRLDRADIDYTLNFQNIG